MSDIPADTFHATSQLTRREDDEAAAARYRAVKRLAGGVLGAVALAGLAFFVRSFPDLRRYLRIERM